uniref:NR LBD domain-containing protein n=1 Tax=Caenorhabditis tropicalis TaxID=1561998 RepID=A0A1I7TPQ3_9PELO
MIDVYGMLTWNTSTSLNNDLNDPGSQLAEKFLRAWDDAVFDGEDIGEVLHCIGKVITLLSTRYRVDNCQLFTGNMEALDRFSREEKDVLRKSWKVLEKNLNNTAYNIFEMIFNQSPDTKQVLESVVKTLDNPETLNPLCDNLGSVYGICCVIQFCFPGH